MHVIRLRGPWQSSDVGDVVRWLRAFHKPTGLETGERVWLVVELTGSRAAVRLNGRLLGGVGLGDAVGRFDITDLLADRNALEIDVGRELPAGGLVGQVRLEIE